MSQRQPETPIHHEVGIPIICLSIASSIVTSVVVTKILATHYFKIVDGYVDDMCRKTREFVDVTRRKLT